MITIRGKIPIMIHPLFWLVGFIIGWLWTRSISGALIALVIIFVSVLFHEFGHAITATLFKQKTRIQLAAFGGFTYREGRKLKLWEEFFVVLNGPVAGFLLFLLAYTIYTQVKITNPMLLLAVKFTYVANLFWTIINLVPVLPLDGGHLLSIILESIFGFKGVKFAIVIGLVVAISISLFFFITGMFIVGVLFLILTFESIRSLRYFKLYNDRDRDEDLQKLFKAAATANEAGNLEQALTSYQKVREHAEKGVLYTMATQETAAILRKQEKFDEAFDLLEPIQKTLSKDHLALFQFLAFKLGHYDKVTQVGNKCFQENPSYNTALINALSFAQLEKADPAIGWLECSLREGLPSLQEALSHHQLDPIRETSKFRQFMERHAT